ncbi:MAG: cell wall hydrolase [Methyloceanibacter sp.]|uniref:cell wall hydrolase n=1 Tax=Methyloceanibacter sp. TaxID=1965321 RepID=UPI003D6D4A49
MTALMLVAATPWLYGCTGRAPSGRGEAARTTASLTERDCLVRAMYFESNRSSHDGLMAVGTVVMNRVASTRFPNTVCGVVSQHRQFAAGVMTKSLDPRQLPPVERAADAVLKGERYAPIGGAMHFHVAGLQIPYRVQYVGVAGGNAFYLKTGRRFRDPQVAAAASAGAAQGTALAAEAPKPNLVQQVFGAVPAAAQPGKTCDASSGFGAISLACETDSEGR